jgi:hypothetical protein
MSGRCIAGRDLKAGAPARSTTAGRRLDTAGIETSVGDQPGNHRVRVPHIASVAFVPTPNQGWNRGHQIEDQ